MVQLWSKNLNVCIYVIRLQDTELGWDEHYLKVYLNSSLQFNTEQRDFRSISSGYWPERLLVDFDAGNIVRFNNCIVITLNVLLNYPY